MPDAERDNLLDDLSAYLDGELSQARAAEVQRLLAESPEARGMLAELREVRAQIRALAVRRAPAELGAGLRGTALRRGVWPRRVLQLGVPLAAAAAAVLAVGLYLHQQGRPQARTTPAQAGKRVAAAPAEPPVAARSPALEPAPDSAVVAPDQDEFVAEVEPEKLEGQGWVDAPARTGREQPALTIALDSDADKIQDRAQPLVEQPSLALAIHPHSDAEYAQYAALLASWPAESSVTNGQSVRYVYQLALPDVSTRVAQLLDVRTAAEEASPAAAMPATPPAARPMAKAGESKDGAMAERKSAGAAGGAAGNVPGQGPPRRLIIGNPREETERLERAHAQHEAVTAEPEIIVIDARGPAGAPAPPQTGPSADGANERWLELLAKGVLPPWATSRPTSVPGATTQASARQVEMRIELTQAAASAPASQPARRDGGPTSGRP